MEKGGKMRESIPTELILEIFTRLPAKSVARFGTLSKHWASMLVSQEFTKLFLSRSSTRPRLLFAVERYRYNEWQLFSSPQPQNRYDKSCQVDFHTRFTGDVSRYICSYASGLIYFPDVQISDADSPLICNPLTGMYVSLPALLRYRKSRGFLGFDPIDKQFKVLSEAYPFCGERDNHSILTLGSGELKWRSNHTTQYDRSLTEGICINGVVYYLAVPASEGPPVIVCFHVRSEEFKLVEAECFPDRLADVIATGLTLVNYKGKLGGITYKTGNAGGRRTVELCMWVLEDVEKPEWLKHVYTLPENEILGSCDFSVAGVTVTGDIVLFMKSTCKPFYVFYFNPERNTLQTVEIQGFGADLEAAENPGQVYAFVDYVEDLSVNHAKQLKSSISQVKLLCSCCKEKEAHGQKA